jgi:ketosteroid isomerase-like protein
MRRWYRALGMALLLVACAPLARSGGAPDDVAALRASEAAWARALSAHDFEALERMLAPEFQLVVFSQEVTTRAQWLANLARYRTDSIALFHVTPRVAGDSASVTLELYWKARLSGGPARENTGVLRDTWRRRGGRWVVVQGETLARRAGYAPSPSPQ